MHLDHVSLWVSDLETSLAFYEDGLGLERRDDRRPDGDEETVETVSVGSEGGKIQLRHDPDRTTPVAPARADVDHFALRLADGDAVDDAFERVADRADCAVLAEPRPVESADAYVALIADPDEYTLELFAPF